MLENDGVVIPVMRHVIRDTFTIYSLQTPDATANEAMKHHQWSKSFLEYKTKVPSLSNLKVCECVCLGGVILV